MEIDALHFLNMSAFVGHWGSIRISFFSQGCQRQIKLLWSQGRRWSEINPNKKRRLQYISLWIGIAVLWVNQFIYVHYEYREHQRLHTQDQQILQAQETQLGIAEERLQILREVVDSLDLLQENLKSVQGM